MDIVIILRVLITYYCLLLKEGIKNSQAFENWAFPVLIGDSGFLQHFIWKLKYPPAVHTMCEVRGNVLSERTLVEETEHDTLKCV